MKKTRQLELRLLNYFLLIAIAAMMIGVEFYFEMSRTEIKQEICLAPETLDPGLNNNTEIPITDTGSPALTTLRNKIVVMFGVLTLVVAIVMMMFVKNITNPLLRMLDVARKISDGDLSKVITIESDDEIGQIGTVINDLTSNFQEIATSTSSMINAIESKLDTLSSEIPKEDNACIAQIHNIKRDLDILRSFVDSFDLLETELPE